MKITRTITTTTAHVQDVTIVDGIITGIALADIVIPGIVPEKKLTKIVKTTYPENPKAIVTGVDTVSALYEISVEKFIENATIVLPTPATETL